ncbi:hypothetical protein L3Y34_013686 [Caenorhabditis briggsae]|uniref:Uncharacterized protein n=1 Tax=Caenorhabditis briggsae TaxID=6238 RepID=A0AAE8ZVS7_CAEBR|nr:hypothetical protein L3Y34_013686 [Caenorhabditis briggsae]
MSSPDGLSELSLEQLRELRLVIREELEEMEKTVKEAKKECERCEKDYNGELHNGLRSRLGCSPIEDLQIKKRIEKKEEKYEKTRAALFETELLLEGHQKDYEHVKELIKHKKIIIESTGEKDNVPDKAKTTVRSKRDADSKVTKSAAKQLEDDYPVFSIPKESRQEAASSPSKSLKHPERREKSRFSQNTSCHREIVSSSLKSPKDQDLKEQEQKEKHRSSRVDSSKIESASGTYANNGMVNKKENDKREFISRMGAPCTTSTSSTMDDDILGKIITEQEGKTNPHLTNKVVEKKTPKAEPPAVIPSAQLVQKQPKTAQFEREVPIGRELFVPKTKEEIFMASYRIPMKKK